VDRKQLGQAIKGWRILRGMSRESLGVAIGKPVGTIASYEQGVSAPGGLTLLAIQQVLDVGWRDLLIDTPSKPTSVSA
jgi:transcriptional regulator with XRE-family HTH domain